MPIPVANIIDTHENVENSGTESSAPSLMFPYRLNARYPENTTNAAVVNTNNHPKFLSNHPSVDVVVSPIASGLNAPHNTNATTTAAATKNTPLSNGSG
jgi:hypothetical protein